MRLALPFARLGKVSELWCEGDIHHIWGRKVRLPLFQFVDHILSYSKGRRCS